MSHLKRLRVPKTWHMDRKETKFVARPLPGGHKRDMALSLQTVLRDKLGHVQNAKELRRTLHEKEVLIDGKRRKEARGSMGIFDVLSIPISGEYYRMVMDQKGRLTTIQIDEKEAKMKVCKVVGKHNITKGKMQLRLHDGKTIISDAKVKVGDSIVLGLPDTKITETLPLEKGAYVYFIRGNRAGTHGTVQEINNNQIVYEDSEKRKTATLKEYAVVIGKGKTVMKLENAKE
jgi:small subunit ribosomal protein S4e